MIFISPNDDRTVVQLSCHHKLILLLVPCQIYCVGVGLGVNVGVKVAAGDVPVWILITS